MDEQRAVEAEIRRAFAGLERAEGVSWSEAAVIDDWGTEEEQAVARALDRERGWEELVDDANWNDEAGYGGFCFLDAIGFAYYLAPAMIRSVRRGHGGRLDYFNMGDKWSRSKFASINRDQAKAIARFLRFMAAVCEATDDEVCGADWREARDSWAAWARVTHGLP